MDDLYTLLETNISLYQGTFEDDFSFLQVGYVSSLEGKPSFRTTTIPPRTTHKIRLTQHLRGICHFTIVADEWGTIL